MSREVEIEAPGLVYQADTRRLVFIPLERLLAAVGPRSP